jgi:small subunit ribosomal protein S6
LATLSQRIRDRLLIGSNKPRCGAGRPRAAAIVVRRLATSTTAANKEYELVLMLDPEIPEERREQIASEARKRIESGGSLRADTAWGMRKLAYEIRQRTEADYRFFRFETGAEVLEELSHNLRIADGVLRFRIFKVDPRSPAIVPPAPTASAGSAARGARRPQGGSSRAAPASEEAAEPAASEATEPAPSDSTEPASSEAAAPAGEEEGAAPADGAAEAPPDTEDESTAPGEQGSEPEPAG